MIVDKRLFQVSPLWAKKLEKIRGWSGLKKTHQVVDDDYIKVLKASEFGCCMVGEYNEWDARYQTVKSHCVRCVSIAEDFVVFKNEDKKLVIPRFEKLIVNFCDHLHAIHGVKFIE